MSDQSMKNEQVRPPVEGSWDARKNKPVSLQRRRLSTVVKGLVAVGIGYLLAKSPVGDAAGEVVKGVGDTFNNAIHDQYKPVATEANVGGKLTINFTKGSGNEVFPIIRSNPIIHEPNIDGDNNEITPDQIASINNAALDIRPGTKIEIDNFTTVKGGDADNELSPTAQGEWAVVKVVKDDGSEILGYISISNQTAGNLEIKGGHVDPVDTQSGNLNLNKVKVINP